MKKGLKHVVWVSLLVLVGFLILAFSRGNYEFVGYWVVLVALFLLVIKLSDRFEIPTWAVVLFSVWSVSHMAGGLILVGGVRLYDLILINILGDPFFILKYDQLIHAYAYVAFSILVYFGLKKYMGNRGMALYIFSVLAALGIGLLNEVIEFGMVVFLDAGDAVGGYYNTALDLVFNLIGSLIGPLIARKFS